MDSHGRGIDPEAGGGSGGLTERAKAALAALVETARRLGPAARRRLENHIEEAGRGNAQEQDEGDRRNAPRGDSE